MEQIVQWATILSPIIAVGLAVWANWHSRKDSAKQIAALEESTRQQVESIKELSRLQIDVTILQVDLELNKTLNLAQQARQERKGISEINNAPYSHYSDFRREAINRFQEEKPERDFQRHSEYIRVLQKYMQLLEGYRNKLN